MNQLFQLNLIIKRKLIKKCNVNIKLQFRNKVKINIYINIYHFKYENLLMKFCNKLLYINLVDLNKTEYIIFTFHLLIRIPHLLTNLLLELHVVEAYFLNYLKTLMV